MCARQQACVGIAEHLDQAVERAEDRCGDLHRLRRRVHADHRIAAAVEQPVGRREEDAADIVARVVRLDADAEDPALAHRVAATGHDPDLARGQHQILVAYQLRRGRRDLRRDPRAHRRDHLAGRGVVEDPLTKLADGQASHIGEDPGVNRLDDQPADLVDIRVNERMIDDFAERQSRENHLGRDPLALGPRRQPRELVARLLLIRAGEDLAQVGEGKALAPDRGR